MPSDINIYPNQDGTIKKDVRQENETVWLTHAQIGQLSGKDKLTNSENISNIYSGGKMDEESIVRKFRTVQTDMYYKFGIFEFQQKVI